MNATLKLAIYEKYRTQSDAAKAFGMREDSLSRIIRCRKNPNDAEKRLIARKLRAKVEALFPNNKQRA